MLRSLSLHCSTLPSLLRSWSSMGSFDDVRADWGASNHDLTPMEHHHWHWHVLGLRGHCTLQCNILLGNSLHRMMVCGLQALFFIVDGWSYFKLGVHTHPTPYAFVGINIAAVVAHSQEPGFFTKDKNDVETKKNKIRIRCTNVDLKR